MNELDDQYERRIAHLEAEVESRRKGNEALGRDLDEAKVENERLRSFIQGVVVDGGYDDEGDLVELARAALSEGADE